MSTKLVTRTPFRGSFVSLATPSLPFGETDESKAKYQLTIVLPKKDAFWKQIAEAQKACAIDKWGKVPANMKTSVKDGDAIVDDDGNLKYPEFEGCYTLQAATKRKPGVVDAALNPVMEADELYSGAYYRATVSPYTWDHPTGGKGVSFALDNVMKVKDGEPFGGAGKAEDDFAEFAEADDGEADGLLG